jgi:hypothetical protein
MLLQKFDKPPELRKKNHETTLQEKDIMAFGV